MSNKIFKSKNLEIIFNENPFTIESIFILPNRTKVCAKGIQNFIVRYPHSVSDPVFLTEFKGVKQNGKNLILKFSDKPAKVKLELELIPEADRLNCRVKVKADQPIWLFEWKISGFTFNEVLVPALGGQALSNQMTEGTTLSYKYPFWWNAQFVVGNNKKDGLLIYAQDTDANLKLLRIGRENNSFSVTYGFENPAPIKSSTVTAELFMLPYTGNWKNAVDHYRSWLESSYKLREFNEHPSFPDWASDINFVLELWGARKSFQPNHTFKQMIDRITEWAKYHSPKNTLLYLAGYAENGIDSHAPDYNPSKQCGGDKDFKKLIDVAHELGYKVMIHTNVLAMTFNHRLYKKFKKYQVVDTFGREQGWAMDMDGDWLTEPYFAYMNPGYKEWGDTMANVLGDLIRKFNIDAVFLDQTLLAFNVSKGPNFQKGMKKHIARLQKSFPEILFAGEGLHELVLPVLPFAQIHGIDSITEVHGMEGQLGWRKAHPVSVYLFGKYSKFVGHLLTKHPSHPMFAFQEKTYSELGVIPVLSLYNNEQKMNLPEVHKMIKRAKSIH